MNIHDGLQRAGIGGHLRRLIANGRGRSWASAAALALTLGFPLAAVAVPVELEGPIEAVDPAGRTITVMGITVNVPPGTPINSPSASITLADMVGAPLPGRTQPGFIGGTAIIIGESVGGVVTAADVFSEPAENVVLGEITANAPAPLAIQGTSVEFLSDPRIPFTGAVNSCGFAIDPDTIPTVDSGNLDNLAAVEGYYGNDGSNTLFVFTLEADGGAMLSSDPQISITRVRCDEGGRLEVQGCTTAAASVVIRDRSPGVGNVRLGRVTSEFDPETSFALYRFRADVEDLPNGGVCPTQVRARWRGLAGVRADETL